MGKHTLEADNFTSQYYAASAIIARERGVETSIIPIPTDVVPAANIGQTTIDAFNRIAVIEENKEFKQIATNLEVKKPSLKERARNFGKNVLKLIKSVRFEKAYEAPQPIYTEAEKQALFAADREHARAKARETVANFFKPRQTENGDLIVEGQAEAHAEPEPTLTREEQDEFITAYWLRESDRISEEQQTEYRALLDREAASLQDPQPMIHLLGDERRSWPVNPAVVHQQKFFALTRARAAIDAAYYNSRNIPKNSQGLYEPREQFEFIGETN